MDRAQPKRTRPPPSLNRKYIRALHDHIPTSTPAQKSRRAATKTVTVRQGDVILVHLTNANGWADGTVLNSGDRGWLPANYCEPYDHEFIRVFFHGLTNIWTAGARDNQVASWRGPRRDEVQTLVSGVKYVLDRTKCLRREDTIIKASAPLQMIRKGLLAELSSLVKHADYLAQQAANDMDHSEFNRLTDEYIRRTYKVAVRLVRFMDVWTQQTEYPDTAIVTTMEDDRAPSRSTLRMGSEPIKDNIPSRSHSSSSKKRRFSSLPKLSFRRQSKLNIAELPADEQIDSLHSPSPIPQPTMERLSSDLLKRRSAAPVLRAVPRSTKSLEELRNSSAVSELLTITQTQFFENVGSFLGLHMQSSPTDETSLVVLRTLGSSSTLIALIQDIRSRHLRPARDFDDSIHAFSNCLSILSNAIQPDERRDSKQSTTDTTKPSSINLMSIATTCIRAAADCVSEARRSLQDHGDYSLDAKALLFSARTQRGIPPVRPDMANLSSLSATRRGPPVEIDPPIPSNEAGSNETRTRSPDRVSRDSSDTETPSLRRKVSFSEKINTTTPMRNSRSPNVFPKSAMKASTSSTSSVRASWRSSTISALSTASTRATTPELSTPLPDRSSFLDTSLPWLEAKSGSRNEFASQIFAHELVVGGEGQLLGGTPRALIEYLIHQTSEARPKSVKAFFLSFHQFMNAVELASTLISQYKILEKKTESCFAQQERALELIRLWLDRYWNTEMNSSALDKLYQFSTNPQIRMLPSSRHELLDVIGRVQTKAALDKLPLPSTSQSEKQRNFGKTGPPPEITKAQSSMLSKFDSTNPTITDFTPLELARQLTLMASRIFTLIRPSELLAAALTKSPSPTSHVRAMSTLSTNITHLVSTSIVLLPTPKPRSRLLKHWIKVATSCLTLRNYDTLMAIMCALNSTAITRLRHTWSVIPPKHLERLEHLKEICEFTRNFSALRRHIRDADAPCLPFIGLFLTDLTFVDAGNPSTRTLPGVMNKEDGKGSEVVNFDKHVRTAGIVETVERFQERPHELWVVEGLRDWLGAEMERARGLVEGKGEGAVGWVWKRSLEVEGKDAPGQERRAGNVLRRREGRGLLLRGEEGGLGFVRKMSRVDMRGK
ncbi:hypothetical protein B9Z65_8753 [Elsinoe australis]|uniref:Ras GEF n=1 Tax=Elsinoe australis TaxID=40998 RepID=A0A2P7YEQ0_9PEZI|nr:hypothetical protein B9Z65_8753 [Elsinoe australis]